MLHRIIQIALICFAMVSCRSKMDSKSKDVLVDGKQENFNGYVTATDRIHQNFLNLSQEVNKRSASLDDVERQDAAQFLNAAFELVMETYVQKGNPAEPGMTVWMEDGRKFGGDNPHTIYTQIPVDHHYAYLLKGRIGSGFYLGFQLYGMQSGFNLPTGNTSLPKLVTEKDGSFALYIAEKSDSRFKNWLPLAAGDHALLLRQYFYGKGPHRGGQFTIERMDSSSYPAPTFAQRLTRANQMLTEYIAGTLEVCDLLKENALNQYASKEAQVRSPKYGGALYPTRDNRYEGFWISLQPGQAIHLHGKLPKQTPYASFVFYNRWYCTPDYQKIRSYLTQDELKLNADSTYDIYISPETVAHPNWIQTGGRYEGSFSSRYLLSESNEFPTVKVVQVDSIPLWENHTSLH